MLRSHADLPNDNENNHLSGEKFDDILQKLSKTKKKSTGVFTRLKKTRASVGQSALSTGPSARQQRLERKW